MLSIFRDKPDPLELRLRLTGLGGWLRIWGLPLLAMFIIANESTQRYSADNTSSYLRPIVERYLGHIRNDVWALGHHIFRKSGHFIGFGLVCLTFLRAWLLRLGCVADMSRRIWRMRSVFFAVACTFLVASADEFHQTFVPGRTGQFSDVLLDTSGGLMACGLVWVFFWKSTKRRRSSGSSRSRSRVGSSRLT